MALLELFTHNASFYSDSLVEPSTTTPKIRLLHIHPASNFSAPLICDLFTVNLNPETSYAALSYVWGQHTIPQSIQLNNRPDFHVTRNLFAAMHRLRQYHPDGVTVWIDAICIKQTDLAERSAQVSIMARIYRGASVVIVYLGCCSGQPLQVVESEKCTEQRRHEDVATMKKDTDPDAVESIFQNEDDGEDGNGPYQWWQRCWTFQETMLARKIIFFVGPHRYTLPQLCDIASTGLLPVRLCLALEDLMGEGLFGELRPENREDDDPEAMFYSLLMAVAARHATDPRDKVYSILGLDVPGQPTIAVDYTKPIETVAYETVMTLLERVEESERGEKFYLLQTSFGFAYRTPWISWVPDFCSPGLLPQGQFFESIGEDGAKRRYGRKASQKTEPFSITGTTLNTQGLEFDTIALTVEHSDIPSDPNTSQSLDRAQWLAQHISTTIPPHASKLQTHHRDLSKLNKHKDMPEWRTIKPHRSQLDHLAHRLSYAGIMEQRYKNEYTESNVDNAKQGKGFRYGILHAISGKETTSASFDWQMIVDMIQPGVCFFVTESGYIGFGTSAVQIGDMVGVLFNFPEVMVLRRASELESGCRLVSEALVPSIQDGQLVQLYKKDKIQAKDFSIV